MEVDILDYSSLTIIVFFLIGNFSFAHSLAKNILQTGHFITATCLDSKKTLNKKYEDAKDHIKSFTEYGGQIIYEVDATQLEKCKLLKDKRFDKIVFNFPHAGKVFYLIYFFALYTLYVLYVLIK